MEAAYSVRGQFVDIINRRIFPAKIEVNQGSIQSVDPLPSAPMRYLLPGFVDAHVHIESSLLIPSSFARLAVLHGTVATVSDPHEIANVSGMEGIKFMVENGRKSDFKFFFGAPSCVPATPFETAGARITAAQIEQLFVDGTVHYLAEMMNWPGVLANDPEVVSKIEVAKKYGKPVDGHAPGLRGKEAAQYAAAGITTDHECIHLEEGRDRIRNGMKVAIREGSAAKNFDALIDLLDESPDHVFFCSDDKHPDSLLEGHINQLAARAISRGKDLFDVLRAACLNPVLHYDLPVGLLRESDPADFIVVEDLRDFKVLETYINGKLVAKAGRSILAHTNCLPVTTFAAQTLTGDAFALTHKGGPARVIQAMDRQLITQELLLTVPAREGKVIASTDIDCLKIAVINRYETTAPPQVALINGFGFLRGAIASSVAHDSHNILVVGVSDEDMARAVNLIVANQGGLAAVDGELENVLPLQVAGLMSSDDAFVVAQHYTTLDKMAKKMGSTLQSPFMTLSFMALLVIPALKLSDKGLFNGNTFQFTQVFDSDLTNTP
jgi:adenine deaminase